MYVMATNQSQPDDQHAFLKRSSVYQEFLAERDEILRYKWLESERVGEDIGFEKALIDWIRKHRDDWRSSRRKSLPFFRADAVQVSQQGSGQRAGKSPAFPGKRFQAKQARDAWSGTGR